MSIKSRLEKLEDKSKDSKKIKIVFCSTDEVGTDKNTIYICCEGVTGEQLKEWAQ